METTDLNLLVTLDALLQESSVTGAARRLGLSTPAVSHALARLRQRFDDPLLVRAGRTMVLTPRAEAMRAKVRDTIALASQVYASPEEFSPDRLDTTYNILASDYVHLILGEQLDAYLNDQAPLLNLRFQPNSVDDVEQLRSGEADLAIGIYGKLPPEMKVRALITDTFVCVVRSEHPDIQDTLTLEQYLMLSHIQIAPRGRPGGYVDDLLAKQGQSRRVARAIPYFTVAMRRVAQSNLILTAPERLVWQLSSEFNVKVLSPPLPLQAYTLSMLWHPRFDGDTAHQWLRNSWYEVATSMDGLKHSNARRRLDPTDPTTGQGRKRKT